MARSTFFYHQKRLTAPDKHAELKQAIRDSFQRNKHRYGYRRVLLDLRNQGWVVNHKLVYKLMRAMGLKAKIRQRRPYISYTGTISYIAENALERNFTPDRLNTVFVSDVTEFKVAGRKVYLSPVMDLFDRSIVAHTVATSPSTAFTSVRGTMQSRTLQSEKSSAFWKIFTSSFISSSLCAFSMLDCTR